ncbi:primase, DNA, polypeptide 1 (49kDa) [Geranomyces michiganensis]|nr:primase, DNA, polypeptide 1 (49kDa) [Geranomyces michiganensis]
MQATDEPLAENAMDVDPAPQQQASVASPLQEEPIEVTSASDDQFQALLRIFYQRLFPFTEFYRWLGYGNPDNGYFAKREWSFTLASDVYIRFQSFAGPDELRAEILRLCPVKIDIGAVYNLQPKDKKTVLPGAFVAKERELVFDIDLTDYDDVRTCCSAADICRKCWDFMTIAIKILHRALTDDFGFKHLLWVYSGRRGVHCWVSDDRARKLSHEARAAIVTYLSVVSSNAGQDRPTAAVVTAPDAGGESEDDIVQGLGGEDSDGEREDPNRGGGGGDESAEDQDDDDSQDESADGKKRKRSRPRDVDDEDDDEEPPLGPRAPEPFHFSLRRAHRVLQKHFHKTVLVEMNSLATRPRYQKILALVPDAGIRTRFDEEWKNAQGSSTERWKKLLVEMRRSRHCATTERDIMFKYLYPRLDANVSIGINHLLKSPFCVHPKTGKVCVPIDPLKCREFNPLAVPTLQGIVGELNTNAKQDTSEGDTEEDFERTALNAHIQTFRKFLHGIAQETKSRLRAEEAVASKRADMQRLAEKENRIDLTF